MIRVAINGFGRIGRNILRALYEYREYADIKVVAIADTMSPVQLLHLLKYDSINGPFNYNARLKFDRLLIDDDEDIFLVDVKDPTRLTWNELDIDIVLECTGKFTENPGIHLDFGAKKVLISAPSNLDIPHVVYGVNHNILKHSDKIVSNSSCTTNCLANILKPIDDNLKIVNGFMTTVHSYTGDQVLHDTHNTDIRRMRAATQSIIPTSTGAATTIHKILPNLKGKLHGYALRVPIPNVSLIDLTLNVAVTPNKELVNNIFVDEATDGLLMYSDQQLVSIDFNKNPAAAIVDLHLTQVIDNTIKIVAWYDNEWAFANRMIDVAHIMGNLS